MRSLEAGVERKTSVVWVIGYAGDSDFLIDTIRSRRGEKPYETGVAAHSILLLGVGKWHPISFQVPAGTV